MEHRFFTVDEQFVLSLGRLAHPVDIHHIGCFFEDIAYLSGHVYLFLVIRAVDFCDECRQYGRSWRHFHQFHVGTVFPRNLLNLWPHAFGDVMALSVARALVEQVYLDVGHVRPAPQVVMAYESVEGYRC